MSFLCFGGSFNPIHHGHLITARAAAEAAGIDRVLLIPSGDPPHKPEDATLASPIHRLAMCQLAVQEDALFSVSDIELKRAGPSYTIETVRQLKRERWTGVNWLIGADMLSMLPQWYEPEALVTETHLIIMARPGWTFDWNLLPALYRKLANHVVSTPLIEISATEIRERVHGGKSIDYLIPARVANYIRENKLYL